MKLFSISAIKNIKRGKRKKESAFEKQLQKEVSDGCFEVSSEVASDADAFSLAGCDTSVNLSRVLGFVSDSSCSTHVRANINDNDNGSLSSEEEEEVDLFDTTSSFTKLKSKSNITDTTCKSSKSLAFTSTSAGGSMKSNKLPAKAVSSTEQLQPYNADKKQTAQSLPQSVSEILDDENTIEISPHIIRTVPTPGTIIKEVNRKSIERPQCVPDVKEGKIQEKTPRNSPPLSAKKLAKHEQICTNAMITTSNLDMNKILHQDEPISDILPHFNRWKKTQEVKKVMMEDAQHSTPDHHTEETRSSLAMLEEHENFDPNDGIEKLKVYETSLVPTLSRLERLKNETKEKRISLKRSMRKHMNNIKSTPHNSNRPTPSPSAKSASNESNNFYSVLLQRELFQTTPTSSIVSSDCREESNDALLGKEICNDLSVVSNENEVIVKGKCVICTQNIRTHVALPCMHFSFCVCCSNEILAHKEAEKKNHFDCPICGEKCTSFSKLKF